MRGGKRSGAGRPEKLDPFKKAYDVWVYVEKRTHEIGYRKPAIAFAAIKFGMSRSMVYRQLEYVGKIFKIIAVSRDGNIDGFDRMVERLIEQGWFSD